MFWWDFIRDKVQKLFSKVCQKNGIEKHVDVVITMGMQESGVRYLNVMQNSESLDLRNALTDPEKSIEQGVKYFSQF
ncbi:MAG: lysozyme family protein [Virgibacillus proomii]|jgi:hypothetical protein